MVCFTHSGASRWCTRTVGSSGLKLKARLGNISLAAISQAKSYIKPLIGSAVLLLQSVDGGIIAIWATVAIHRQKLICSRRSSRQTLHRAVQAIERNFRGPFFALALSAVQATAGGVALLRKQMTKSR